MFVISDIHGRKDRYDKIWEIVKDDPLIVLGDVIDRGNYGIDILLDLADRKNVTFIMGNHEHMMFMTCFASDRKQQTPQYDWQSIWSMPQNGGFVTFQDFSKRTPEEKQKIKNLFQNAYVLKNETINGQKYRFVHGGLTYKCATEDLKFDFDAEFTQLEPYLWTHPIDMLGNEPILYSAEAYEDNVVHIVGHTPVQHLGFTKMYRFEATKIKYDEFCNPIPTNGKIKIYHIDGGCAIDRPEVDTSLILYDVENDNPIYIK